MNRLLLPHLGGRFAAGVMLAAAFCLITGCKVDLNDELEQMLGSMSSKSLETQYPVDGDPLMNAYLTRMGHSLVAVCDRPSLPYTFKLLDTDQVNALAAPYGHIYVFKGLLDLVETEDELAAVLGHEVTHVVRRHSLKSFKETMLFSLVLGSFKNKKYDDAKTVLAVGNLFRGLRHSRQNEYESDYHGTHYSILARYDPAGAPGFFGKLQKKYGNRRPSRIEAIFSTHPVTTDRVSRTENLDWIQQGSPQYVTSMLAVARGFADRYQYRAASAYFGNALTAAPDNAEAHLGLAVALAGLGQFADSREQYRWVADRAPDQADVGDARDRIALYARAGGETAVPSARTRSALRAMAPRLRAVGSEAAAAESSLERASATALRSAGTAANALVGGRSLLGEVVQALPEGNDAHRDPLLAGLDQTNGLIERAVSEVEAAASRGAEATGTLRRTAALLATAMATPADETAARELLRAAEGLVSNAPSVLAGVRESVAVAASATQSLDNAATANRAAAQRLWDTRGETADTFARQSAGRVKREAERARAAAAQAARRSKEAREQTIRSRFRAVALEADGVAATANAVQRRVLDGMLAHYFLSEPETVTALRERQNLPAADRIMTLGEAKQNKRAVEATRPRGASAWTNVVDRYEPQRLDNLAILAKLFVNAAKFELGLGTEEK